LYVGNIPQSLNAEDVANFLGQFGELEVAGVLMDAETRRSKELGFGDYIDDVVAEWAEVLNGKEIDGRPMVASVNRLVPARTWTWSRRSRAPFWRCARDDEESTLVPGEREEFVQTFRPERTLTREPEPPPPTSVAIIRESSVKLAECIAASPNQLDHIEWRDLERMVAVVFDALGFEVQLSRGSKDGGVDVRLRNGPGVYLVQVKHWLSGKQVGKDCVRLFVSVVLCEMPDTTGIILSTSGFTHDAVESLTIFESSLLRLGDRNGIVNLCRAYVRCGGGLFQLMKADETLTRATTTSTVL
jgi:hypothetical protein